MTKKTVIAVIAVFILWSIMDFVIHGILLTSTYEATANLWRPMEEMKTTLMYIITLVYAACFVLIYGVFINDKSTLRGIQFGALFGLASGISMGFGSYSYMPIPLSLAWSWFAATLVELIAAGAVTGLIMKPEGNRD